MNSGWLPPDLSPIFLTNVFVNLGWDVPAIQPIAAASLGSGNPVILTRVHVIVVGLETRSLQTLKSVPAVIQRTPSLRTCHAADPPRPGQTSGLALNVHDTAS